MKIQFLGTAAAEGIPGMFCQCETCCKSRKLGGKNIRTRSQAIVDDTILIDFPADTYYHSLTYGIDLSHIQTCLITHDHSDHLYPNDLWCRSIGIANDIDDAKPLTFYAPHNAYRRICDSILEYYMDEQDRVRAVKTVPFVPFDVQGYTVTPLKARHSEPLGVVYVLSKDGKTMLYAHDTGYFPEETLAYLKKTGLRFDLVSFDCTGGLNPDENYGNYGHLTLLCDKKMRKILQDNGNMNDNTVCIVNHFSHNGTPIYEEMAKAAEKEGFLATYDGMTVEF